jgi:hypothetical protein
MKLRIAQSLRIVWTVISGISSIDLGILYSIFYSWDISSGRKRDGLLNLAT